MTHTGRTFIALLGFILTTVAVGAAQAAPPHEKRRHQQGLPTGAEDAPAAAAKAKAAAPVDSGEALIEQITRKDTTGLYIDVRPDGSVMVNLDERFQHVSRAVTSDDGTTQVVCDDKPAPRKAAQKASLKAPRRAPAPISKTPALEER
jgi:hypothetical protein